VAGHQPNYLPWLGFFDKMFSCDLFIIEDSVLLENEGFIRRNSIKGCNGPIWLTVPQEHVGDQIPINKVHISTHNRSGWRKKHWLSIKYNYCKAPFWSDFKEFFEDAYNREWQNLVDLNMHFINGFRSFFGIETRLVLSSGLHASGKKNELIIAQCKEVGATTFLSGLGAKSYLDVDKFTRQGINVVFQNFKHPVYKQLQGQFVPNLSAIDYLFCAGSKLWKRE
jgi:hypothetical protein